MVEVLRRGGFQRNRVTTCHRCKSKLRFNESEGRIVKGEDRDDALVIQCPVCGSDNWLDYTA